jgi:hypothetical protein
LTRISTIGLSDLIDINSLVQTIPQTEWDSRPASELRVASTTNTDTPIPDFNNLVIDPDDKVLNTSQNILNNEEPKLVWQVITRPSTDLSYAIIEGEIDIFPHNSTSDIVDRPTNWRILDSQWVIKIKPLAPGSEDKIKVYLVAKGFSEIQT